MITISRYRSGGGLGRGRRQHYLSICFFLWGEALFFYFRDEPGRRGAGGSIVIVILCLGEGGVLLVF